MEECTPEKAALMKDILKRYAPLFFDRKKDGSYRYNYGPEGNTAPLQDVASVLDACPKPPDFADNLDLAEGQKCSNNDSVKSMLDYLAKKGVTKARPLGHGAHALALDLGNGDVLRIVTNYKVVLKKSGQETLREPEDVVLQPRHSSARENETLGNFRNVEIVPRLPRLDEVLKAAAKDYAAQGKEFPIKDLEGGEFFPLIDMPTDFTDKDFGAGSNWGVDPAGNLLAIDPGAVIRKDLLPEKRVRLIDTALRELRGVPENKDALMDCRCDYRGKDGTLLQAAFFGTKDPKRAETPGKKLQSEILGNASNSFLRAFSR